MLARNISLTDNDINKFYNSININLMNIHGCILWGMPKDANDYGKIQLDNFKDGFLAHRVSFYLHYGELPRDKVIDHKCKRSNCVNPLHLQAITNVQNVMLGGAPSARNARKTSCKRGHEFTPENTYNYKGIRCCRQCRKTYAHNYEQKHPWRKYKK